MSNLMADRTQYVTDLLEAASIVDVASLQTQGEGRVINNNVLAHIMGRVYQNGYVITNGID
jgi:hypothetical protein